MARPVRGGAGFRRSPPPGGTSEGHDPIVRTLPGKDADGGAGRAPAVPAARFAAPGAGGHRFGLQGIDRREHARHRTEVADRGIRRGHGTGSWRSARGRSVGCLVHGRQGGRSIAAPGRSGVVVAILLVLAAVGFFLRSRESATGEPPPRSALRVWDLTGCWALELDPWAPPAASGVAGPPASFLLVADSLDEWGRRQETFRAEPVPDTLAGSSPYRWFVRADTLWLVWRRAGLRGGLALRARDDGFVGRARVTDAGAGVDVTARAEALRVNCATGRPEPPRSGRR